MIQHYPRFEQYLRESARSLVGKDVEERIDIGLAKDGSGVGGAFCFSPPLVMFWDAVLIYQYNFPCLAALCALQATKQQRDS